MWAPSGPSLSKAFCNEKGGMLRTLGIAQSGALPPTENGCERLVALFRGFGYQNFASVISKKATSPNSTGEQLAQLQIQFACSWDSQKVGKKT